MKVNGRISMPGDKSISHRAIMLGAICKGKSTIYNIPNSKDILATINCLKLCGVDIKRTENKIVIQGGFSSNVDNVLDCKNSGTTARLLLGLLSAENIAASLYGDQSLSKRPMGRVIDPLQQMGANIISNNKKLPIDIKSSKLKKIDYSIPIPSAQVKSSIIFAALGAQGTSKIRGCIQTRDHLEKMLSYVSSEGLIFNDDYIEINPNKIIINEFTMDIPGDISSASFFIALACLLKGSKLIIENLILNKYRMGFVETLKSMGANIVISDSRIEFNELVGTITVIGDRVLSPCVVSPSTIPSMIDEIPILALLCSHISGISIIDGLGELKYKESDRYLEIIQILSKMGVNIKEYKKEGYKIKGENKLYNTNKIDCKGDHRLAMMVSIAQILSKNKVCYDKCIHISFPSFELMIKELLN